MPETYFSRLVKSYLYSGFSLLLLLDGPLGNAGGEVLHGGDPFLPQEVGGKPDKVGLLRWTIF